MPATAYELCVGSFIEFRGIRCVVVKSSPSHVELCPSGSIHAFRFSRGFLDQWGIRSLIYSPDRGVTYHHA